MGSANIFQLDQTQGTGRWLVYGWAPLGQMFTLVQSEVAGRRGSSDLQLPFLRGEAP